MLGVFRVEQMEEVCIVARLIIPHIRIGTMSRVLTDCCVGWLDVVPVYEFLIDLSCDIWRKLPLPEEVFSWTDASKYKSLSTRLGKKHILKRLAYPPWRIWSFLTTNWLTNCFQTVIEIMNYYQYKSNQKPHVVGVKTTGMIWPHAYWIMEPRTSNNSTQKWKFSIPTPLCMSAWTRGPSRGAPQIYSA